MAIKQDKAWQYTFSTALAAATLLLVFGYFAQSFIEIRKVKPVSVAIERLRGEPSRSPASPLSDETAQIQEKSAAGQ